jgi:hypothetical protein
MYVCTDSELKSCSWFATKRDGPYSVSDNTDRLFSSLLYVSQQRQVIFIIIVCQTAPAGHFHHYCMSDNTDRLFSSLLYVRQPRQVIFIIIVCQTTQTGYFHHYCMSDSPGRSFSSILYIRQHRLGTEPRVKLRPAL